MAIRVFKVPEEFKTQAHDKEYICHHLYSKVAGGSTIRDEEIGSFGVPKSRDEDCQAVLCFVCEVRYNIAGDTKLEIVPWPA